MLTKSGELLKKTRLKKEISLVDVEKGTKIRGKFLRALEEGDYTIFHSMAYARGFVKNYAEYLGLDTKLVLALFRRETNAQTVKIVPSGMVENGFSWFRITPTRAAVLVGLLIVGSISYYLFGEYRGYLGAPNLSIEKPIEQETVMEGELEVAGKADIDTTIIINGDPATLSEDGRFTKTIRVFEGETTIIVTARNRRGKETTIIRKITVR